jgi:hypothetical protein
MDLQELEAQATFHLLQAFVVVGLLQETDSFYTMISQRLAYINTSRNMHFSGADHSSGHASENMRCKGRFAEREFQLELMERLPEIAVMERLYQVAVEVNRFQRQELEECSSKTRQ